MSFGELVIGFFHVFVSDRSYQVHLVVVVVLVDEVEVIEEEEVEVGVDLEEGAVVVAVGACGLLIF